MWSDGTKKEKGVPNPHYIHSKHGFQQIEALGEEDLSKDEAPRRNFFAFLPSSDEANAVAMGSKSQSTWR